MDITSSAFTSNSPIPRKYTCDGDDISPPLRWSGVPASTRTVAVICDDPDAPRKDFVHWVVFNVPARVGQFAEHLPTTERLPDGGQQGMNDFGNIGYGGPCPPSGTHHYRFTLYAVDRELDVPASATKNEVLTAMKGHVLATAQLKAVYTRSR